MFDFYKCAVCGMSLNNENFQKIIDDPKRYGQPLYYQVKKFNPDLDQDIKMFCTPEHSLEFYQKQIDNETENN